MENDLTKAIEGTFGYFDAPLFEIAGTRITVATLVTLALILVATLVLSQVVQRIASRAMKAAGVTSAGTRGLARNLIHYSVLVIGFCVGLQTVGIDLSALFAAGAIFAVAFGFAMQNIMQNFVSGVILLLERTIKPGDLLRLDGQTVRVVQMGMRATIVRTRDEEDQILPNSMLVTNAVVNHTLKDTLVRLRVAVGVTYDSDMALVRRVLEQTVDAVEWRVRERPPVVYLRAFGNSSVDFEATVWHDDPWEVPQRSSDLHEAIWWALKEAGVTIAFPQVDVHLDGPVVQSLQDLSRTA